MNGKWIEIITKAGLAGIALVALMILYLVLTGGLADIGKYINENTKVLTEVRESIKTFNSQSIQLEETVRELNDIIKWNNRMGLGIKLK